MQLKKDYLEGVGDTLDLVVIGGFHGTGKRAGKYGGFLLACYDEQNEEYQVICKVSTVLILTYSLISTKPNFHRLALDSKMRISRITRHSSKIMLLMLRSLTTATVVRASNQITGLTLHRYVPLYDTDTGDSLTGVQVWEVKAADLSISPVYTAAAGIVSIFTNRKS